MHDKQPVLELFHKQTASILPCKEELHVDGATVSTPTQHQVQQHEQSTKHPAFNELL